MLSEQYKVLSEGVGMLCIWVIVSGALDFVFGYCSHLSSTWIDVSGALVFCVYLMTGCMISFINEL